MLALLIFQSDIMDFSKLSNGDFACNIVPLEMTLKFKHILIKIVIKLDKDSDH